MTDLKLPEAMAELRPALGEIVGLGHEQALYFSILLSSRHGLSIQVDNREERVTAITNALRVANLLVDVQGIDLVLLGGAVRPGEQTLHGHLTEWGVHQFRADKLIYGTEAISLQHGITHSQIVEVGTDRALANVATQVILLVDHTKFGKVAPAFVFPLDRIHVLVSDQDLPDEMVQSLTSKNIKVIRA